MSITGRRLTAVAKAHSQSYLLRAVAQRIVGKDNTEARVMRYHTALYKTLTAAGT
ncbi:MAG: hypothetical protein AAF698_04810 [Pseudomonadota bacterium]